MSASHTSKGLKGQLLLALGALGVVYGDIGTSPLYAIKEIFFGHHPLERNFENAVGVTSLVVWALTLIVTFKYVVFVLRADHKKEGGVFALYSLLQEKAGKYFWGLGLLLILAAGLLFGDGIITPAISVISSVEGLAVATSAFQPFIVPITLAILTGLFFVQKFGTAKIGQVFGPVIALWFVTIGALGVHQIVQNPGIVAAINPWYAMEFLIHAPLLETLAVLGSVMLVVTGGEAMYADMGHFGRTPIRISWFALTYPALLLNYFGQGAFLLSHQAVIQENIFFSMVPSWGLIPMVILATLATIIASQALITGAFSLAAQAINLHLIPYLKTFHTHEHHQGQIYIPFVNWSLFIGCIALVIVFQNSTNLASAYGLAVSGVMLVTTISMIAVAKCVWNWKLWQALALFVPLAAVDSFFLTANSLKLLKGGFIPLSVAIGMLILMKSWNLGRRYVKSTYQKISQTTIAELVKVKKKAEAQFTQVSVILTPEFTTSSTRKVPFLQQLLLNKFSVLPRDIIYLTVKVTDEAEAHDRYTIHNHFNSKDKGSITSVQVNFGFMEETNVEAVLEALAAHSKLPVSSDPKTWQFYAAHERIFFHQDVKSVLRRWQFKLYNFLMKNSQTADQYYRIGEQVPLSIETVKIGVGTK
jgi:KUP system potassium uptake protein